jgi:hypothetical protein
MSYAHEYTLTHPEHGNVTLNTDDHHSAFASFEDFLDHHHNAVAAALGVTSVAVSAFGIWIGGRRLK